MNETRRKPTTGRQSPSLCDKWHGICSVRVGIMESWNYQHMKVSHSNTVWLGYIQQLYAKYSIGGVNTRE